MFKSISSLFTSPTQPPGPPDPLILSQQQHVYNPCSPQPSSTPALEVKKLNESGSTNGTSFSSTSSYASSSGKTPSSPLLVPPFRPPGPSSGSRGRRTQHTITTTTTTTPSTTTPTLSPTPKTFDLNNQQSATTSTTSSQQSVVRRVDADSTASTFGGGGNGVGGDGSGIKQQDELVGREQADQTTNSVNTVDAEGNLVTTIYHKAMSRKREPDSEGSASCVEQPSGAKRPITLKYTIHRSKVIGKGSYGVVCVCTRDSTRSSSSASSSSSGGGDSKAKVHKYACKIVKLPIATPLLSNTANNVFWPSLSTTPSSAAGSTQNPIHADASPGDPYSSTTPQNQRYLAKLETEISILRLCRGHPFIIHLQEVLTVAGSSSPTTDAAAATADEYVQRDGHTPLPDPMTHTPPELMLITSLSQGGDLFHLLTTHPKHGLTPGYVKKTITQLLSAVSFLHSKGVVHRDIKLENVTLDKENCWSDVKLIDFGLSCFYETESFIKRREVEEGERNRTQMAQMGEERKKKNQSLAPPPAAPYLTRLVGSSYYVSPQVLKKRYTEKCDLWSLGVILYMLLSGAPPFYGRCDEGIRKGILKGSYEFPDRLFGDLDGYENNNTEQQTSRSSDGLVLDGIGSKDLITRLLEYEEVDRWSADEALEHPWLRSRKGTCGGSPGSLSSSNNSQQQSKGKKPKTESLQAVQDEKENIRPKPPSSPFNNKKEAAGGEDRGLKSGERGRILAMMNE